MASSRADGRTLNGQAGRPDMEIEDAVGQLLAYENIRQLAARYAVAMDRRDFDALAELFTPDVQIGRNAFGRQALRESMAAQLREMRVTIMNVGTHQIDLIDATSATGHVYCKGEIHHVDEDGTGRWIHQAIRYDDTYAKVGDEWLFARRKHLLFYGAELGSDPSQLEPAHWPANHTGLGTLPYSEPTWQAFHEQP
jgi:ketosteroid isomerase-like protein